MKKRVTKEDTKKEAAKKIPDYAPNVTLDIFEIGNFDGNLKIDLVVNADLIKVDRIEWEEVYPCAQKITHKVNLSWNLQIKRITEDSIIDLSSKPLLVTFTKSTYKCLGKDRLGIIQPMITGEELIGCCAIDMFGLFTNKQEEITQLLIVEDMQQKYGKAQKTWSNQLFFKYTMKSKMPLLSPNLIEEPFIEFSMSFDYIINTLANWHSENFNIDAIVQIPIGNNQCKHIKLPKATPSIVKDNPKYYTVVGLEDIEGPAKFSKTEVVKLDSEELHSAVDTNCLEEDLERSKDNIPNIDPLDSPVYAFYRIFRCKMLLSTLNNIIAQKLLSIEFMAKAAIDRKSAQLELYCGFIDVGDLANVDVKVCENFVSLMLFNDMMLKALQCKSSAFATKAPRKLTEKRNTLTPTVQFLTNAFNCKTKLKMHIEIEYPLIARIHKEPEVIEMSQTCSPKNYYYATRPLQKRLDLKLRDALGEFLEEFYRKSQLKSTARKCLTEDTNGGMKPDMITTSSEGKMLEVACNWLSWRMNFQEVHSYNDILDDAYVAIISKIHELRNAKEMEMEKKDLHMLRLQYANECFELNLLVDACRFYLLNIGDNPTSSSAYIDYAIYNLLALDMCKSYECCAEAIKYDYAKNSVVARLIQAYIFFANRSFLKAECILLELTKFCDNFLEGWFALFLINFHKNQEFGMESAEEGFIRSINSPFLTMQHKKQELLWILRKSVNPYLNAIVTFIQWGCIGFAELGLAYHVHHLKCESFDYCFNMALIDYYKRDYNSSLRRLRCSSTDNHYERVDKLKLQIHCLLNTKSPKALTLLKELAILTASKCFDRRTNLIYMKIAELYSSNLKFRTARFYLKKCCFKLKTYAGLKMLGYVAYKCQNFGLAEKCYKLIYELNPFNDDTWPYLTIIYYSMDRVEQYKDCDENAKKIINLNEDLQIKLDVIRKTIRNSKIKCLVVPVDEYEREPN